MNEVADVPLSLAHLSELDTPPLELIDAAAAAGLTSVGLRTAPASPGGPYYPLASAAERDALNARIEATGVSVLYIELITLTEATRPADYREMFETGAAIGATRVAVAGDSRDFVAVAHALAGVCDLAAEFGLAIDLEFMPYRGVASLNDAVEVIDRADRTNALVLLDALHFQRSGSTFEDLARVDPSRLGTFQICDGPLDAPDDLVAEARQHRRLPGDGEFPLDALMDALPANIPIGAEVPLYVSQPTRTPAERLTTVVRATRRFLARRS